MGSVVALVVVSADLGQPSLERIQGRAMDALLLAVNI
jgi:hypothetical protein